MATLWNKIKAVFVSISPFLIAVLAAMFFLEKKDKDVAEQQALNAETKAKDDALKAQQEALESDSAKTEQQAEQEKAAPQTTEQIVQDLNKL